MNEIVKKRWVASSVVLFLFAWSCEHEGSIDATALPQGIGSLELEVQLDSNEIGGLEMVIFNVDTNTLFLQQFIETNAYQVDSMPAGSYIISVKVYDPGSMLLAEGGAGFDVLSQQVTYLDLPCAIVDPTAADGGLSTYTFLEHPPIIDLLLVDVQEERVSIEVGVDAQDNDYTTYWSIDDAAGEGWAKIGGETLTIFNPTSPTLDVTFTAMGPYGISTHAQIAIDLVALLFSTQQFTLKTGWDVETEDLDNDGMIDVWTRYNPKTGKCTVNVRNSSGSPTGPWSFKADFDCKTRPVNSPAAKPKDNIVKYIYVDTDGDGLPDKAVVVKKKVKDGKTTYSGSTKNL